MIQGTLYRLPKDNGGFTKDHLATTKPERTEMKVTEQFVEETNDNWKQAGYWFEVDQEATAALNENIDALRKEIRSRKIENRKTPGQIVKEALGKTSKKEENVKTKEKKNSNEPTELDLLKHEADKLNIKYHHMAGVSKLKELIAEANEVKQDEENE